MTGWLWAVKASAWPWLLRRTFFSTFFFLLKNCSFFPLPFWRLVSFAQYVKRLYRQRQSPEPSVLLLPLLPGLAKLVAGTYQVSKRAEKGKCCVVRQGKTNPSTLTWTVSVPNCSRLTPIPSNLQIWKGRQAYKPDPKTISRRIIE